MPKRKSKTTVETDLRKRAEAVVPDTHEGLRDLSPERVRELFHDLRLHQVELEMQNDELRRAREEIAEARDRYASLYDHAPVGSLTLSDKGHILLANLTAAEMLGVERGALINQPLSAFLQPESGDILYRFLYLSRTSPSPQTCEVRLNRQEDSAFWVRLDSTPILDDARELVQFRIAMSDISNRKQAEQDLRQSGEERWLSLTAVSRDKILILDTAFRIQYCSRPASGFTLDELIDRPIADFLAPHDVNRVMDILEQVLATQKPTRFDTSSTDNAGNDITFESEAAVHVVDGEARGIVLVVREITERKRLEFAHQDSLRMLQTVLDAIPAAVFWKNRDSVYLGGNRVWLAAAGLNSSEEVVGKSDDDLPWDEEQTASFRANDKKVMESGVAEYDVIESYRRADGAIAWAKTNKIPLRDAQDNIIGVLGTYEDVTERRQAEENLKRAHAELERRVEKRTDELRESEEHYKQLVNGSPAVLYSFSDKRGTLFCSNYVQYVLGYSAEHMLEHPFLWYESIHPDDALAISEVIREAETGAPFQVEYRIKSANGEWIWLEDRSIETKIIGDETIIEGLASNISTRKQSERALAEALDEVRRLKEQLEVENIVLRERIQSARGRVGIIGRSAPIQVVLNQARQVAETDSTVLLLGETGTGKELLAEAIHDWSPRRDRPFVRVACAAIPSTLLESELFGREKGAYTGALSKQAGRFEAAEGGTLFLDEVGELPADIQVKLLRVLEKHQFERLGSSKTIQADVRIIAATNRDLVQMVREASFREDLFYRLNVFPLTIPPRRERAEDIPELVWSFVKEFSTKMGKAIDSVPSGVMNALQQRPWPGNIRELRNIIERAMIRNAGPELQVSLPDNIGPHPARAATLEEVERRHIVQALEQTGWRIRGKNGAADRLALKPTTLESKMLRLGIERPHR